MANAVKLHGVTVATDPTYVAGDEGAVTVTTTGRVRTSSGGEVAHDSPDSGAPVKIGGYAHSSAPTAVTNGDRVNAWFNPQGVLMVGAGDYAGDAGADGRNTLSGFSRRDAVSSSLTPVAVGPFVFNGTTWDRKKKPSAVSRIVSAANSENATVVKASAGDLFHINGHNAAAAVRYIKLYNKATTPSEADTPFMTLALAASVPFAFNFNTPVYVSTGISLRLVTGSADADDTAVTAADILGLNVAYV